MPRWLNELVEQSSYFMPHGHCYLWIPSILWMHVVSNALIGAAYVGIALILYLFVSRNRIVFSPVFIAFGLFIGLCGLTHFMSVWTIWNPDYLADGLLKVGTAAASVATAIGLFIARPRIEEVLHTARLSEQRRIQLESANAELEGLYRKLRQLDEVKTQFFANVSHELRTPLALIIGPAEHLMSEPGLSADQQRQLNSISQNAKSLLKQVNDLLDIARLEADRMDIHYGRTDIAEWFRSRTGRFAVAAEQRDIRYKISAPAVLMGDIDADLLDRVLINLLSNAFKFTPSGGHIAARLASEGGTAVLSVTDSGPGIRPDQHEIIFQRFRQAEGGRQQGGTGLGLAIARDLVVLHRGSISLQSDEGKGASFVVRLPLEAPAGAAVAEAAPRQGTGSETAMEIALAEAAPAGTAAQEWAQQNGRASVLVVEDNVEMSALVAGTLSTHYNVLTAADGQQGLEQALASAPDLVITDLMMPRMSGDELVAALREHRELDAVPILLLTARADDALRVKLLQGGAQDYLTKPFLPRELLARAGNLIAMKRAGDALRQQLSSVSGDLEELARELTVKHRQLQLAFDATQVAREQAERASEVKSQFLGMMSHEMRTPLSTLSMNAELLARQPELMASDAARARLERLMRATRQMSSLIEGLLEYTRVESGRLTTEVSLIDAATVAREIVEMHADLAAPGVRVDVELARELPEPLATDPKLLRVLLSNLVANALKFTHEGKVTVWVDHDGPWRIFEVRDTGIGIAPEDLGRIFLPFEQLEPVQRKSIPGVGLGLALVQRIGEALGGRVEVESIPGKGSVFRLRLPQTPASQPLVRLL